jgi:dephospho-CoA kinase
MLTVGLTGSIAVGKSFVCSVLRKAGVRVLDADVTARDVVAKGTEGLAEVVKHFGDEILTADGELDRKALGAIVFSDEKKRLLLNSLIHPRVFAAQDAWLLEAAAADPHGIAVIDAALMIESGGYKRFNKIIVVWCEPVIQLERLMLRDGLGRHDAEKRIAAQMPQDQKKRFADHLIDTSHGFDDTRRQTLELVEYLRQQATDNDDS